MFSISISIATCIAMASASSLRLTPQAVRNLEQTTHILHKELDMLEQMTLNNRPTTTSLSASLERFYEQRFVTSPDAVHPLHQRFESAVAVPDTCSAECKDNWKKLSEVYAKYFQCKPKCEEDFLRDKTQMSEAVDDKCMVEQKCWEAIEEVVFTKPNGAAAGAAGGAAAVGGGGGGGGGPLGSSGGPASLGPGAGKAAVSMAEDLMDGKTSTSELKSKAMDEASKMGKDALQAGEKEGKKMVADAVNQGAEMATDKAQKGIAKAGSSVSSSDDATSQQPEAGSTSAPLGSSGGPTAGPPKGSASSASNNDDSTVDSAVDSLSPSPGAASSGTDSDSSSDSSTADGTGEESPSPSPNTSVNNDDASESTVSEETNNLVSNVPCSDGKPLEREHWSQTQDADGDDIWLAKLPDHGCPELESGEYPKENVHKQCLEGLKKAGPLGNQEDIDPECSEKEDEKEKAECVGEHYVMGNKELGGSESQELFLYLQEEDGKTATWCDRLTVGLAKSYNSHIAPMDKLKDGAQCKDPADCESENCGGVDSEAKVCMAGNKKCKDFRDCGPDQVCTVDGDDRTGAFYFFCVSCVS